MEGAEVDVVGGVDGLGGAEDGVGDKDAEAHKASVTQPDVDIAARLRKMAVKLQGENAIEIILLWTLT